MHGHAPIVIGFEPWQTLRQSRVERDVGGRIVEHRPVQPLAADAHHRQMLRVQIDVVDLAVRAPPRRRCVNRGEMGRRATELVVTAKDMAERSALDKRPRAHHLLVFGV